MRSGLPLGVAEAGFFPGIILYLTYWFPSAERARIVSLFMAAVPLATVFGGPLSGALLGLHGFLGIDGWHWLFVIEGLPAVLLGIIALKLLTDRPKDAEWLTAEERNALEQRLAAEAEETRAHGYAGLGQALTKPRVLLLGLIYFCMVVGLYGIGFWMPQVIQTFGLSNLAIGFLTAIPYLFAAIAMVLPGATPTAKGERIWHVALPLFLSGAAFAWSANAGPLPLVMLALSLAALGTLCRDRHLLVAADLDPDRHRRRGGARAHQLHRQLRWICRSSHRRAVEGGNGRLHRGASVSCRRARHGRRSGAPFRAGGGPAAAGERRRIGNIVRKTNMLGRRLNLTWRKAPHNFNK